MSVHSPPLLVSRSAPKLVYTWERPVPMGGLNIQETNEVGVAGEPYRGHVDAGEPDADVEGTMARVRTWNQAHPIEGRVDVGKVASQISNEMRAKAMGVPLGVAPQNMRERASIRYGMP